MKKSLLNNISTFVLLISLLISHLSSYAHCEVPCGIFQDSVRISLIKEHIITIEKSMNKIIEISKDQDPNYNQLVRWINNKEEHAEKIQDIISQYFLHQRIKVVDPAKAEAHKKYQKQLELLHHLMVNSMKCKQTTDLMYIEKLRSTLGQFEGTYFHAH